MLLRLLRTPDAVIAPSQACRQELLAAGFSAQRIHVIANGVDTAAFRPEGAMKPTTLRPICEGPVVVFTGRLIKAKGLLELLEAWPLLLREVPRAHLVLVGDGTDREALRARARALGVAERVHLAGWVEDVVPFLWAADAFALPSHTEGMPNGLLEAMATGLPCVATSVAAVPDVLRDGGEPALWFRRAILGLLPQPWWQSWKARPQPGDWGRRRARASRHTTRWTERSSNTKRFTSNWRTGLPSDRARKAGDL